MYYIVCTSSPSRIPQGLRSVQSAPWTALRELDATHISENLQLQLLVIRYKEMYREYHQFKQRILRVLL